MATLRPGAAGGERWAALAPLVGAENIAKYRRWLICYALSALGLGIAIVVVFVTGVSGSPVGWRVAVVLFALLCGVPLTIGCVFAWLAYRGIARRLGVPIRATWSIPLTSESALREWAHRHDAVL